MCLLGEIPVFYIKTELLAYDKILALPKIHLLLVSPGVCPFPLFFDAENIVSITDIDVYLLTVIQRWIPSSRPCLTGIVEESSSFWNRRKWPFPNYWRISRSLRRPCRIISMYSKDPIWLLMRGEDSSFSIRSIIRYSRRAWIWYLIYLCNVLCILCLRRNLLRLVV